MEPEPPPTDRAADEALARWRQARDPRDLGRLFDLTAADLFRVALHLCPDAAAAEDALQETFLAVMEHPERYEPGRPARPWMATILRNHASKGRRSGARVPDPARLRPPAPADDPLLSAQGTEERARVRVALLTLEEPYREAALLRWRYGLEPAEIAEVKGVPPGTVSSWLHRAVEKLRVEMGALPTAMAVAFPDRGLTGIKASILQTAAAQTVAAGAGAGAVALAATGGGIVAGKMAVTAAAAGIACLVGFWALRDRPGGSGGDGTVASADTRAGTGETADSAPPGPGARNAGDSAGTSASDSATPPSTTRSGTNAAGAGGSGTKTSGGAGSSGGKPSPPANSPPASMKGGPGGSSTAGKAPLYDAAMATATIRVKAVVRGAVPKMRPIKFDADPKCGETHKEEFLKEDIVAGKDGRLANVITWVSRGHDRWTFPAATEPAVIDQQGCVYIPHVLTVRTGQPVVVRNLDAVTHNVHAQPKNSQDEFNKGQGPQSGNLTMKFSGEEVAVKVKCDIHSWMQNWVGVFSHPFHGVTGADGTVVLRLPPGTYEVSAWHEFGKWKTKPAPVETTVAAGETKEIEFVYGAE